MRPVLAQTPFAKFSIATSAPVNHTLDSEPSLSLPCTDGVPAVYRSNSTVSNDSPNCHRHSSPQSLSSRPQPETFLTDIHSCTPNCSPPASPLHQRAPSEITIDLCLTLAKRRELPVVESAPGKGFPCSCRLNDSILTVSSRSSGYPEDSDPAPSPAVILSPIIPSMTIPGVSPTQNLVLARFVTFLNLVEPLLHKSPNPASINPAADDLVESTFPLSSPPSELNLELTNCALRRPLRTVVRSSNTSLQTGFVRSVVQPPFLLPSAFCLTTVPPLDNVINQGSEGEQKEGRGTPTPTSYHEQGEDQVEREDTPLSYIVSETTQEETRSTSGDSFVLSPTSPFFQPTSKVSFVSSSIAYPGQISVLPPVSASSTAGTYGEIGTVGVGEGRSKGPPTSPVRTRNPVTLKTPRALLAEDVPFYASVRKRRIFRKDELAEPRAKSNVAVQPYAPLPILTDDEEVTKVPMIYSKKLKIMRTLADSDSDSEEGSNSEPTLLEQSRWQRRQPQVVQNSSPAVDPGESEEKDVLLTLGSTAAAPIILDSDPETEVDVHPVRRMSVIDISSGNEVREEEAGFEFPITVYRMRPDDSTVPAPRGRFLCVEVPTLQQIQRARARAAGKLPCNWIDNVNPRETSWILGIASQTAFSPNKPRLLSSASSSEDELNWDEKDGQEEDRGLVSAHHYMQWFQRAHAERLGYTKVLKSGPPSSRPPFPPRTSPMKRKRMETDGEGDTDELDEWVPEPVRPALGHARRRVVLDRETESVTDDTMSHPALSIKKSRATSRRGPILVQFQCLIPGHLFGRPPAEPFRSTVTQANASIDTSTIRAPKFTSRAPGCSFGCHNCRSSTDRNVKIRCSNSDRDTGGQCMHHWCERCLVLWYAFDGRGLLSAYTFSGEELGLKEIKALGGRGADGGVGLGLGLVPGKWICPNCLGKCMCTYCTKKDGRSRSRFKNDTIGIPLDLEGLEGLEGAPGLRGVRRKEKKKPSVALATSFAQSTPPNQVSVVSTSPRTSAQNGESVTSSSPPAPSVTKRPRITRELQDLLNPEFGHAIHVNDHGKLEIYKQDAAGNVVCVGVPTRMRTRACPDGAPESMGGVGVSATELYKPVFLPGERERWRREVGLGEESAASDSEVDMSRSISREVEGGLVEGSEGLPRRANFVNVPWGAKLPQAQKRVTMVVQTTKQENEGEEGTPPIAAQLSRGGAEHSGNLGHHVELASTRYQTDLSLLFNFDGEAEAETAAGSIDLQGERRFTNTEPPDTALYTMDPYPQDPPTGSIAPTVPHPMLELTPTQEWSGWETMALEFGDPSFHPLPSCGPLTMDGVSTVRPPCSSPMINAHDKPGPCRHS